MVAQADIELIIDEMSQKIIETAENLVLTHGAHMLTVRQILKEMEITNRVFYNRFHNIEEVLDIVYKNISMKVRQSIMREFDTSQDFFEYVKDVVVSSLEISYDTKMHFTQYIFESDSNSSGNFEWWVAEIKKLIDYAKEQRYIRDVDSDVMSYAIWCFCRGYNADAVGRNLPKEEAVRNFRYSFGILLDGMRI